MIFGTGETYTLDGNRAAEDPTSWRWHPELHSREASLVEKYGFSAAIKSREEGLPGPAPDRFAASQAFSAGSRSVALAASLWPFGDWGPPTWTGTFALILGT